MIKVVVCDGDGTLQLPSPSKEIHVLLRTISLLNIHLVVATNAPRFLIEKNFQLAGLPLPLLIVARPDIGVAKPSPKFIDYIISATGAQRNEIVFLGDDDKTDIFCAINSRILPFAAIYSNPTDLVYGLPVTSPIEFAKYLETFAHQDRPYFGWEFTDIKNSIETYALFGDHNYMGLTPLLKTFLKDKKDTPIGSKKNSFGRILFHYLLSQSYLSGLIQDIDYISVYPGHLKDSQNEVLSQFSGIFPRIFRNSFLSGLLVRHTNAVSSHSQRGDARNIYDQLSTISINPDYRAKIRGKSILVLDDFTTSGNSLETARQMLLRGGASRVVGLAFAKYRATYNIASIKGSWDPYAPFSLQPDDIAVVSHGGSQNKGADDFFYNVIWKEANR